MKKALKTKKEKIPKINEEQYAQYISLLRGESSQDEQSSIKKQEERTQADLQ